MSKFENSSSEISSIS